MTSFKFAVHSVNGTQLSWWSASHDPGMQLH